MLPGEVADVVDASARLEADVAAGNIIVPDGISPTADAILAVARSTRARVIAVDYVQMLDGYGGQKAVLDDAVRKFQTFAQSQNVCVILVSQQKQEDTNKTDPRPGLSDMLGSSAMRIGAKLVIGLFRPYNYCKVPTSNRGPYAMYNRFTSANPDYIDMYPEILEAWVLKNVLGRTGALHWRIDAETGVVENADDLMRPYL
jgi:replicative DNA helicase